MLKPPSIAAQPQVPLAEKFSSSSYQKQQQPPPSPAPAPPPPPPKEEPEYSEPPPPQPIVEEPPPAEPEAHKPLPPPIVVQSSQVTERGFERAPVLSCSCLTDRLLSLTPLLSGFKNKARTYHHPSKTDHEAPTTLVESLAKRAALNSPDRPTQRSAQIPPPSPPSAASAILFERPTGGGPQTPTSPAAAISTSPSVLPSSRLQPAAAAEVVAITSTTTKAAPAIQSSDSWFPRHPWIRGTAAAITEHTDVQLASQHSMITQSVVTALDAHALRLTESVQAIAREVASAKEPIAGIELAWSEASSDLREEMRVHANTLQKKAEAYSMNPPDDPLDKLLCMAKMREEGKAVSHACMRFREEREEHAKVSSTGVTGGGGGGGGQPSVAVEDPVMEGIDQQLLQIKRKTDETIALELQSLRDMQTRVFSQFSDQIHDLLKASSLGNEKLDGIERRLEELMNGSLPPQHERGGEVDDDKLIALARWRRLSVRMRSW